MDNSKKPNFLSEGIIDNPLNIKRVDGDLPSKKASPKNMIALIVVGGVLALYFNTFWHLVYSLIGIFSFTLIIVAIVYAVIIAVTAHFTVMEGPRNVRAFRDYLINKVKDLSILWEIQSIKEWKTSRGDAVGYIDYIDSSRCMIIRCIPGIILNRDPDMILYHNDSLVKALNNLDELGYSWEIDADEYPSDEDLPLNYLYTTLRDHNDSEFVQVFTGMLDHIKEEVSIKSKINYIHIKVFCYGRLKHDMLNRLTPVLEVLRTNTSFHSVKFLTATDINKLNAEDNSVNRYDDEELIMNKYKNTASLGVSAVIRAKDERGNVQKEFAEGFNIKKKVKISSMSVVSGLTISNKSARRRVRPSEGALTEESQSEQSIALDRKLEVESEAIGSIISNKKRDTKLLEILYSDEKVKLGE